MHAERATADPTPQTTGGATPQTTGRATPQTTGRPTPQATRTAQSTSQAPVTGSTKQARVEQHPCSRQLPAGTICGFLIVPERRDAPSGTTIKVGYAVHHAEGPGRKADAVVYMGGGPGASSQQLTGFLVEMLPNRDVITIEQRGDRFSEPRLQCPEIAEGLVQTLQTTGQAAQESALLAKSALACQDRLSGQASLSGYRTSEIAADVVDLRKAIGYSKWNLLGVSYSTRVMLQAAAKDPQGTRSVVLDSLVTGRVAPNGDGWPRLAATIAKLGITARFDAMVARLNAKPVALTTRNPITDGEVTLLLDGTDVATILAESLQSSDVIPIIPALVDGVADGRTWLLQPLVDDMSDGLLSHEWGLYYTVLCQDQPPPVPAPGSRPLFTYAADAAACPAWPVPPKTAVSSPSAGTTSTPGKTPGTGSKTPDRATGTPGKDTTGNDITGDITAGATSKGTTGTTGLGATGNATGGKGATATDGSAAGASGTGSGKTGTVQGRTPRTRTTPGATGSGNTRATGSGNTRGTGRAGRIKARTPRTPRPPVRKPALAVPILVLGGQFDATTPPEAARETAQRTPSARFVEFAGVGHAVFLNSGCGRRTIAAFLDDPAASAPCDPAEATRPMVQPGTIFLTSSAYEITKHPVMLLPLLGFTLVSALQLLLGLVALVRRRGDWLAVLGGLLGLAFIGLVIDSLRGFAPMTLAIGLPEEIPWYGLIAIAAWLVSTVSAFRLRARTFAIVPCLAGLAFITWMYGWLVV
ncbi:alpha/beta fold hydrolase [Planotetraspora silvatica]|uniref:alpha/beta fold hydrolase n=1 Tax=Planotetraspora silvatica TaxID=234614 RepID=UPI00194DB7D3|nr:alpha/beta hydrolase [Planotetraspora silvatica]